MIQIQPQIPQDSALVAQLNAVEWNVESMIPLPPQAVIEFCTCARRSDMPLKQLCTIVESEPALTMELLKHVNSASQGLRHQVESVDQAISLLGVPASTMILLTKALSHAMERIESPLVSNLNFRRESLERAAFSREVANSFSLNASQCYTASMLQDILLPLLTQKHEADYREFLTSETHHSIVEFEKKRFGWTHAEVTAKTLLNWGFPHSLVLSVLKHHDSPESYLASLAPLPSEFAVSCSSLLMDVLHQSEDGITRLLDLQHIDSRFQVVELAHKVDQSLSDTAGYSRHPLSLVERMQNSILSQIEVRRHNGLSPGRQHGNYILEEKIRESTMGAIFKARHVHLRRPTALKILRVDRTSQLSISQFETEVQHTCELRHPNIITIFDYGRTPDDLFYYAMELIEGLTLTELCKECGPLPDGRVIPILMQVCSALAEAHDRNLIHRDIKPENIMISHRFNRPDHVTLLDFGLVTNSTVSGAPVNSARTIVGTPHYISPEAAEGLSSVSARSDLYSLGAVGFFLLTGKPVFTGRSIEEILRKHLLEPPPDLSVAAPRSIAHPLKELLSRCLQKSESQRPVSAISMMEELANIIPAEPWSHDMGQQWWSDYENQKRLANQDSSNTHQNGNDPQSFSEKTIQI